MQITTFHRQRRLLRRIAAVVVALLLAVASLSAQSTKKNGLTGWDYFQQKKYADALELLKQDHRMWPKIFEITDGIGWCQYFLGDYAAAEESFKEALSINPDYKYSKMGVDSVKAAKNAAILQAESLLSSGKYFDAIAAFADILASKAADESTKARAIRGKGYAHYYLGQFQQALKDLTAAVRAAKDDAIALAGIGFVQYARKNWNDAETVLEQAVKLDPSNLEAQLTFAWCALQRGNVKAAEERFDRVVRDKPASWGARLGIGWCRDRQKDEQGAIEAFKTAVRLSAAAGTDEVVLWAKKSPARASVLLELGWKLIEAGSAGAALQIFAIVPPEFDPDTTTLGKALASLNAGDNLSALRAARSLLDRSKDPVREVMVPTTDATKGMTGRIQVSALTVSGWAHLRLGDVDESRAAFTAANERRPLDADGITGLGWVHLGRGDYVEAEKSFLEAVNRLPGYGGATSGLTQIEVWRYTDYTRAWTKIEAGEYQAAEGILNALRADPAKRFPPARTDLLDYSLGVIARRLGRPTGAAALFEAALTKNATLSEAQVGLGWALVADKRFDAAEKVLEAAITARPFDSEPHRLLAKALVENGKKSESLQRIEGWAKAFYLDTELGETYARLLIDEKRYVEAKIALSGVLSLDPDRIAKVELEKWMSEHKEFQALNGPLGWGLYARARSKEALDRFKAAAAAEPGDPTHQKGIALSASALGDETAARAAADVYLASLDKTSNAAITERRSLSMTLAWNSYYGGNAKSALEQFQKIEKSDGLTPGADVLNALGWCWIGVGKGAKAKECFLRAIALDPRLANALKGLETAAAMGSDQ